MRASAAWLAILAAFLSAVAEPARAADPAAAIPDWIDRAAVERGDIPVQVGDDGHFHGHIASAALVAASPEAIWAVLLDCASVPDYVPSVRSCTLLQTLEEGRAQIFRQEVKFAWFLPLFEHVFRLEYEPYRAITVSKVSGPFKRLDGKWSLIPIEDGRTIVVYSLEFEAGLAVPDFMVGARLRKDIPNTLAAIRERAER